MADSKTLKQIRDLAETLKDCKDLKQEADQLRLQILQADASHQQAILIASAAIVIESIRQSQQITLYDVQLISAVQLTQGRVAQMATGEGKTFVAIATAGMLALHGRGVHVMTPGPYLAKRDYELAAECLLPMGLTVGLTEQQQDPSEKSRSYNCDITYGEGSEFGFDYLRDQYNLRQQQEARVGVNVQKALHGPSAFGRETIQRSLAYAIIDEADSVMFDDAISPLVLSTAPEGEAADKDAVIAARSIVLQLKEDVHYQFTNRERSITLTSEGEEWIYAHDIDVPTAVLQRTWTEYVEQALRAEHIFRRDLHYTVVDSDVRIVGETTGQVFEDRSWQDGLHQAVEAKEGVSVTPENTILARVTRQRFLRLYDQLCGMTGTLGGCEIELKRIYECDAVTIPLRIPDQKSLLNTRFFKTAEARNNAICHNVCEVLRTDRPVLVGTQSIRDSEQIARALQEFDLPELKCLQVLNGRQDQEEAEIVAQAGHAGTVTVATNLAGRGTDIKLAPDVVTAGGLHVIVAECQLSSRMDRQLIGRAGRQGDPGSAQTFVSADDELLQRYGPWLSSAIQRDADSNGESTVDYSKEVRQLQQKSEAEQQQQRQLLLEQDQQRESLLN